MIRPLNLPATGRLRRGFTLIEVLIVLVVLGILAALAYPSYTQYVLRSRRTEAKAALLDLAMRQERYFSINNVYADAPGKLGYTGAAAFPIDVLAGSKAYYRISANLGAGAATYSAVATPVGAQAADSCGEFSINQFGVLAHTGNPSPASACW